MTGSVTSAGVRTVARQEFRLRIRAGRWRWLLGLWVVLLVLVTAGLTVAANSLYGESSQSSTRYAVSSTGSADVLPADDSGAVVYGGLVLFVLGLALLVVPALSSQSVNGDRERGTLAVLQVTRLSAAEIALGKFLAAWGTALVFLALTAPMVAWSMTLGGVPLLRVLAVALVLAGLLAVVVAVSLALSALLARSTTSSLLSYLAVAGLTVGTLIAFGLVTAATTQTRTVTTTQQVPVDDGTSFGFSPRYDDRGLPLGPDGEPLPTRTETYTYETTDVRTDRTWWLLAPNPFVILADAAPPVAPREIRDRRGETIYLDQPDDPLSAIGTAVRDLRRPVQDQGLPQLSTVDVPERGALVWPYGLAADLLLAAGALTLTVRRLRTPARVLPAGQRVA